VRLEAAEVILVLWSRGERFWAGVALHLGVELIAREEPHLTQTGDLREDKVVRTLHGCEAILELVDVDSTKGESAADRR
jgi:hypothetical protein